MNHGIEKKCEDKIKKGTAVGTLTLLLIFIRFVLEIVELIEVGFPPLNPILPFILFITFDFLPICENLFVSGWKLTDTILKARKVLKEFQRAVESENGACGNNSEIDAQRPTTSLTESVINTENETSTFLRENTESQKRTPNEADDNI